jgi:hypothetical protein
MLTVASGVRGCTAVWIDRYWKRGQQLFTIHAEVNTFKLTWRFPQLQTARLQIKVVFKLLRNSYNLINVKTSYKIRLSTITCAINLGKRRNMVYQ